MDVQYSFFFLRDHLSQTLMPGSSSYLTPASDNDFYFMSELAFLERRVNFHTLHTLRPRPNILGHSLMPVTLLLDEEILWVEPLLHIVSVKNGEKLPCSISDHHGAIARNIPRQPETVDSTPYIGTPNIEMCWNERHGLLMYLFAGQNQVHVRFDESDGMLSIAYCLAAFDRTPAREWGAANNLIRVDWESPNSNSYLGRQIEEVPHWDAMAGSALQCYWPWSAKLASCSVSAAYLWLILQAWY